MTSCSDPGHRIYLVSYEPIMVAETTCPALRRAG